MLHFTGFYWVSLGFTGFYWVLLGFTGFYWVLLGFTGFCGFLMGYAKWYIVALALPGMNGFWWTFGRVPDDDFRWNGCGRNKDGQVGGGAWCFGGMQKATENKRRWWSTFRRLWPPVFGPPRRRRRPSWGCWRCSGCWRCWRCWRRRPARSANRRAVGGSSKPLPSVLGTMRQESEENARDSRDSPKILSPSRPSFEIPTAPIPVCEERIPENPCFVLRLTKESLGFQGFLKTFQPCLVDSQDSSFVHLLSLVKDSW